MSQLALSWLNRPCALKAAIGIGKQTLATLAGLPRHRGRSKAYCGSGADARADRGAPIASMAARTWRCGNGAWDPSLQRPAFGAGQDGPAAVPRGGYLGPRMNEALPSTRNPASTRAEPAGTFSPSPDFGEAHVPGIHPALIGPSD